jgi:hypothetical protein
MHFSFIAQHYAFKCALNQIGYASNDNETDSNKYEGERRKLLPKHKGKYKTAYLTFISQHQLGSYFI